MDEIIENEELVIIDNTQENAETINIDHPYLKYNEVAGILYLDNVWEKRV